MVTTVRLTEFLPYVLPYAPKCPRPTAEFALRRAAKVFCERTRCWRHITTQTLTTQGSIVVAPSYATIHEFETATLDGAPLTPTQFTDIDPDELTGSTKVGKPEYITQIEPGLVSVYPFAQGLLRVSLFLKPRAGNSFGSDPLDPLHDSFNVVPDFMLIQHADSIASGALALILSVPDQPFTNEEKALFYSAAFEKACGASFQSNIRGQQRAKVRTKPRWF